MAEFQLAIRYDNKPQKVGFYSVLGFVPVWSFMAPFVLGCLITYFMREADKVASLPFYVVAGSLMLPLVVVVAGFMLTAVCEDDRLYVTTDGISFQPWYQLAMKGRRRRTWDELASVSLVDDDIQMVFKDGAAVALSTKSMSPQDLEQFLMAIEAFAKGAQRDAALTSFQSNLQNTNKGITGVSYTELWDDELSRRFHSTSFVPLEPDTILRNGSIKIVRQLAFGGFSAIYLAQKDGLDLVVLKEAVVPKSADEGARETAIKYLEKESALLCSLEHPHIARVQDFFVEDNRHYLLLEYITGQDLRQFIKQNGAQDQVKVLDWALKLADILAYLHGQNPPIIHRDLTPDNIVLKNDGEIVLIDFGAANEFLGTATGTLIGKQAYIAPEQLRGKANKASDLYSFGGTIYYLLTGKEPVPLSISHPKSVNPDINEELDKLVSDLSAFEESERLADAVELKTRLTAIKEQLVDKAGVHG